MKKGQLSAEMLILIVVVIAIIALVASQLTKTSEKASNAIDEQSDVMLSRSEAAVKAKPGEFCTEDMHCLSESCDTNNYKCN